MRTLILGILAAAITPVTAAEPLARDLVGRPNASGEFSGWKSFHEDPASATRDVWQLREDGVLVCKGNPRGYLYTEQDYTDVKLEFEWRWPPEGKPGNGGLLLRTSGEHAIWPKSLEVQLNHGQAGDFWGLAGYELSGPADRMRTVTHPVFGQLTNVKRTQALEKPAGQWNHCAVTLEGGKVSVTINGELVNEASGCDTTPGKIALTAEGAEIHFRNPRLHAAR